MDINDLRAVITVLAFVTFIGIVAWAYGRERKGKFDDAARLPFESEPGEDLVTIKGTQDER
jgi:cytochrome c oxidase cbb3-type subunit 4